MFHVFISAVAFIMRTCRIDNRFYKGLIIDMTEETNYTHELYSSHCASSRLNATSYDKRRSLDRGWMLFEERVDLNFGLLDKLLARGLLNEVQYEDVKASQSTIIGWKKLSEYIQRNSFYDLVLAIQITKQQHLLNYAWNSGIYNPKFGGDWPLTDRQMTALNINQEVLVELMEMSSELVEQLYTRNVLNKRHKDFICGPLSELKRNETFLDILRQRSFRDYKETIKCLRASNQAHIAEILEGGVVARIFCSVTSSKTCPVNRSTSKAIFERYSKKLKRPEPLGEEDCKFQLKKIGLIGVGFDNGVVLYFNFKKKDDFENLEKVFDHGELNTFAEADFNNLLSRDETSITVLLHWTYYDRNRCDTYIRCRPFSNTCINKLPMEVLEIILTTAYALYFRRVQPRPRDKVLFEMLSSVSRDWQRNIAHRWFKSSLNRRLSPYFLSVTKRQTIIRSNRQYLMENMEPSSNLIRRLEQVGCLTSEEANHIESLQHNSEKNHELLNIAKSLSFKKHFAFIESLHFCCQLQVANVLERGGVVVMAKIIHASVSNSAEFVKLVNENISALNKNHSEDLNELLVLDKQETLEVLEVKQFGGRKKNESTIMVYLWCKSQKSLRTLRELLESDQLFKRFDILISCLNSKDSRDSLRDSVHYKSESPQFLKRLTIDAMQFQKEVAVRQMSLMRSGTFDLTQSIKALTSLDDKIYVLLEHLVSIHQDIAPFACQSRIAVPLHELQTSFRSYGNVNHPYFMVACDETKCIYIANDNDSHLWKFTTPDYELEVWMSEIGNPFSVYVTRNGNVVLMKQGNDPQCNMHYRMEIYNKDATFVNEILLPRTGVQPHSAMEISPGKLAFHISTNLVIQAVDFRTLTADPVVNWFPQKTSRWMNKNIAGMTSYCEGHILVLLSKELAILDSQLNVDIISTSSPIDAGKVHFKKDKRQLMFWSRNVNTVQIYTLEYKGEDMFADDP